MPRIMRHMPRSVNNIKRNYLKKKNQLFLMKLILVTKQYFNY